MLTLGALTPLSPHNGPRRSGRGSELLCSWDGSNVIGRQPLFLNLLRQGAHNVTSWALQIRIEDINSSRIAIAFAQLSASRSSGA
jgi:hypothetical protein